MHGFRLIVNRVRLARRYITLPHSAAQLLGTFIMVNARSCGTLTIEDPTEVESFGRSRYPCSLSVWEAVLPLQCWGVQLEENDMT